MSTDPIVVAALIVLGSICGLLLSIIPALVSRVGLRVGRWATRALNAASLSVYVAIGWWVHYELGVSYPREHAAYMEKLAADELACEYCMAPIDGRHAWLLFWIVAGLVAYAVRSNGRHRVLARRAAGATLSLSGLVVTSFAIAVGETDEILVALIFAAGFIATGMAVAGAPRRRGQTA
jgi:hypothetical protein